jgi:aspartate dehydrogenase
MKDVALIGRGAIGSVLAEWLLAGRVPGHRLAGVMTRSAADPGHVHTLRDLLSGRPGLVIEAASQEAARAHVPAVLAAGVECLMLSVGAFADPAFEVDCRSRCATDGPRLLISTGAIGGIDALKAMHLSGTLRAITLTSTMSSRSLIQPWMDAAESQRLAAASEAFPAFEGTAREAASRFPRLTNIAATISLATLGLDNVQVRLIAEPRAAGKTHVLHATCETSDLTLRLENRLSQTNPHTSAMTPMSVLRYLIDCQSALVVGV